MKDIKQQERTCPLCGKTYKGIPALSRADNETLICPDCGTRQALTSIGIDAEEQEKILDAIHRSMDRCTQDKA